MADAKVSVIVPVYNVEKYLRRCLDSIINQTYRNLEIILVDDGSPDRCGEICDEYAAKDPRIRVIHQKNGGVSNARNAAIRAAVGEYIVFIDSDDQVRPDYVTNLMACGNADYVAAGCCVQNEQLEWNEWKNHTDHFTLDDVKKSPEKISFIPLGMVWAHRFKREIIIKNQIFFRSDVTRGEDTLFNSCYLAFCNTIAVTDHADYLYYFNTSSATSKLNPKLFQWSMESVLAVGQIIGTDNKTFHMRVWRNAMIVCDNYFQTARDRSAGTNLQMIRSVMEVCSNTHVRQSLPYARESGNRRKAFLVQFRLYPFLPFLYSIYDKIHRILKKG